MVRARAAMVVVGLLEGNDRRAQVAVAKERGARIRIYSSSVGRGARGGDGGGGVMTNLALPLRLLLGRASLCLLCHAPVSLDLLPRGCLCLCLAEVVDGGLLVTERLCLGANDLLVLLLLLLELGDLGLEREVEQCQWWRNGRMLAAKCWRLWWWWW
jgi:hypothetical protein